MGDEFGNDYLQTRRECMSRCTTCNRHEAAQGPSFPRVSCFGPGAYVRGCSDRAGARPFRSRRRCQDRLGIGGCSYTRRCVCCSPLWCKMFRCSHCMYAQTTPSEACGVMVFEILCRLVFVAGSFWLAGRTGRVYSWCLGANLRCIRNGSPRELLYETMLQ